MSVLRPRTRSPLPHTPSPFIPSPHAPSPYAPYAPPTTRTRARTARALAVTAASVGLVALGSTTASAHVTASPTLTAAESYSLVTFSVGHGCDGSATKRLDISVPKGVNAITPTITPGWKVRKVMTKLDEPVTDAHGATITERVSEVVYTADTALADGYRQAFELQLQLPDQPGQALNFPTVQVCDKGETAWIEIPKPGQAADDLEHPAPAFTITAAAAGSEHGDGDGDGDAPPAVERVASDSSTATTPGAVSWAALGLGVAGAALGGAALVRTRRN